MLVRALVNDIECHSSGRRLPPGANVDIDPRRFLFHDDFHVFVVLILVVPISARENGLNGHTFSQAFPYPFHLQSTSSCIRSDLESGFGGVDEERRNGTPAWYGKGVGTREC